MDALLGAVLGFSGTLIGFIVGSSLERRISDMELKRITRIYNCMLKRHTYTLLTVADISEFINQDKYYDSYQIRDSLKKRISVMVDELEEMRNQEKEDEDSAS